MRSLRMKYVILFFTVIVTAISSSAESFNEAAKRAAFISQALNTYSKNQSLLSLVKKNLSKKDQKEFEAITKNIHFMKGFKVESLGNQVLFLKDAGGLLISVALEDETHLLVNGWIKLEFDPQNIFGSLLESKKKFSLFSLFMESAYAGNIYGVNTYENALYFVAAGGSLKEIPAIKFDMNKNIGANGSAQTFYPSRPQEDWGGPIISTKDLKVTCNSQNRAKVTFREKENSDEMTFDDKGEYLEITKTKPWYDFGQNDKSIKVKFETERRPSSLYEQRLKECVADNVRCLIGDPNCSEAETAQTNAAKLLKTLPNNFDKASKVLDLATVQAEYYRARREARQTVTEDVKKLDLKVKIAECIFEEENKYKLIPILLSGGKLSPTTIEEMSARLTGALDYTQVVRGEKKQLTSIQKARTVAEERVKYTRLIEDQERQIDSAQKALTELEKSFQNKHHLREPLRLDSMGKILNSPRTEISSDLLSQYAKEYREYLGKIASFRENIEDFKAKQRAPTPFTSFSGGIALIRAFGRCCGDNECKEGLTKDNFKIDYKSDGKDKRYLESVINK